MDEHPTRSATALPDRPSAHRRMTFARSARPLLTVVNRNQLSSSSRSPGSNSIASFLCTHPLDHTPVCTDRDCVAEGCVYTPNDDNCEQDPNDCTVATCGEAGCEINNLTDGTECDDGDGQCQSGTCVPNQACTVPEDCTDGNECQDAACVGNTCTYTDDAALCTEATECTSAACGAGGCEYPAVTDGAPCSGGVCGGGACVECNVADDCAAGTNCQTVSCVSNTCTYTSVNGLCSDSNECTANVCGVSGCENPPLAAGTGCSLGFCDGAGICVQCLNNGHCDDGNACTDDICSGGTCSNPAVDCYDGDACKSWFCDSTTGCGFDDIICDDSNECTANTCNPGMGCQHPNLTDSTPCSIGECQSGVCTAPPPIGDERVFRMNQLVLADPHVVAHKVIPSPFPLVSNCTVCRDITHNDRSQTCWTGAFTLAGINPAFNDLVTTDGNDDGYLDLSFMLVFEPHNQANGGGGDITATEGLCLETDQTNCVPDPDATNTSTTTYTSQTSGTCLGPIAGTLGPWAQGAPNGHWTVWQPIIPPNEPSGACFVSAATTFTIRLDFGLHGEAFGSDVDSLQVPLIDARIAGEWAIDPATSISNGLVRGFLTMQEADQQHLTLTVDLLGAVNLNLGRDLLPDNSASVSSSGAHGCGWVARSFPTGGTAGRNTHCKGGDTRDLHEPGSPASYTNCGWWFYFNFTGTFVENAEGF
jgi:hypothetical protein